MEAETNFRENETQSGWNLSQALIMQIGELLRQASYEWLNGYSGKAFWCYREIFYLVLPDMSIKELKKGRNLELEYFRNSKENGMKSINLNIILTNYRSFIMMVLKRHGYFISRKEDSSRMF